MATTNNYARQYELGALVDIDYSNVGAGNDHTVKVPAGALVTISAHIATAFTDATTATLSASDGTTTFISAEDLKAAALTNVTIDVPRKFFPNGGTITVSSAVTGTAPTAGRALVNISYVVLNRQSENQF